LTVEEVLAAYLGPCACGVFESGYDGDGILGLSYAMGGRRGGVGWWR